MKKMMIALLLPCFLFLFFSLTIAAAQHHQSKTHNHWKHIIENNIRVATTQHVQYDTHPFDEIYSRIDNGSQYTNNNRRNILDWQDIIPTLEDEEDTSDDEVIAIEDNRYEEDEDINNWQDVSSGKGDSVTEDNIYFEDNRYPTTSSPTSSPTTSKPITSQPITSQPTQKPTIISYDPSLYKPLRIKVDTRQLQSKLQSNPQRYSYLVDYISTIAATKVSTFWSQHLSTISVSTPIVVTKNECIDTIWPYMNDNEDRHVFANADLVLYILLDEGPCLTDTPTPIALSNDCIMDQWDRPIVGILLLCSTNFVDKIYTEEGKSDLNEVLQHELGHILGMSGSTMPYWRNALKGGKPYTPRPLVAQDVVCISGQTQTIYMPSQDIIRSGVTKSYGGSRYFEIVTPTVRNVIANQFNCHPEGDIIGARLDPNEYYNCIGSHLSSRYYGTETMVSRNMPWTQSISAVSLALFEDTGWYKANYTASSGVYNPSPFGYGAGCQFLTEECIVNGGEIPTYGKDTFCNEMTTSSSIKCDVTHRRGAKCDLVDYNTNPANQIYPYTPNTRIPERPSTAEEQHFTNTALGSFIRFDSNYCPTYAAPTSFTLDQKGRKSGPQYMECSASDSTPNGAYSFETFDSTNSMCFNTVGEIDRPLCLSMECIEDEGTVTVQVSVGEDVIICESDGQILDLPGQDIQVECPRVEILCPQYFCPANCSGRGVCQHGVVNGCVCNDPNDESPHCENSLVVPPNESSIPSPSIEMNVEEEIILEDVVETINELGLVDTIADIVNESPSLQEDTLTSPTVANIFDTTLSTSSPTEASKPVNNMPSLASIATMNRLLLLFITSMIFMF